MITDKKILKQLEVTQAAALNFLQESTVLKEMLAGVSTPATTPKGKYAQSAEQFVARRRQNRLRR